MSDHSTLRASEIGEFVYCARAWWLERVAGYPSAHQAELELGEQAHQTHSRRLFLCLWAKHLAYLFLAAAVALGLVLLAWGWMVR